MRLPDVRPPDYRECVNLLAVGGAAALGGCLVFGHVPAGSLPLLMAIVTGLFAVANSGGSGAPPGNPQ